MCVVSHQTKKKKTQSQDIGRPKIVKFAWEKRVKIYASDGEQQSRDGLLFWRDQFYVEK